MIVRTAFEILFLSSIVLAGFYIALWRVKKRLRPAASLLDEGLQSVQGGLFKTAMAKGHFHGRPIELRVYLSRWGYKTFNIRTACDSHLDFTIWAPGPEGVQTTVPVNGYALLAAQDFGREFASISRDPSGFLAWAQQPATKERLNILANARDNWRLELRPGTLESTDFMSRKDEFAAPEFPKRTEALTHLASSLEAVANEMDGLKAAGPEREI